MNQPRLTFWLKLWAFWLRIALRLAALSVLAFFIMVGIVAGLFVAHGLDRLGFPPPPTILVALSTMGAIGGAWVGWPLKIWRLARTLVVHEGPRVLWRRQSPPTRISEHQHPAAFAALRLRLVAIPNTGQYDGRETMFRDKTTGLVWRYHYIEDAFSQDEVLVRVSEDVASPLVEQGRSTVTSAQSPPRRIEFLVEAIPAARVVRL